MKDIICQVCGAGKRVQDTNVGKYCSLACKSAAVARLEVDCPGCGKHMKVLQSQWKKRKYCSRQCQSDHVRQKRTRICEQCGKSFEGYSPVRFCSRACAAEALPHPNLIDGRSLHPEYNRWYNMMARCLKPEHPMYPSYGGRGITVCAEWQTPANFYGYLEGMGPCPPGYSLDRINNNGNYEPGNIRWASQSEQNSNRNPYSRSI